MTSTYTDNLGIEKPATGDRSGTWGTMTNTNMDIIDRNVSGVGAITLSGTTHTLTTTDGSLSDGQFRVLVLGGSPSGTNTITIDPNDQDKFYFVVNNSGQSAIIKQGSGSTVTIADGASDIVFADGAGSGAAVTSLFGPTSAAAAGRAFTAGTITAATAFVPDAADGATLGTTALEFSDVFLADGGVINFGNDQDVTLTHVADTGLTMAVTGNNDATLQINADVADATVAPFLVLNRTSDSPADDDNGGVIKFDMENDNNEQFTAAAVYSRALDVSDGTEDGQLLVQTMVAGTLANNLIVRNDSVAFKVNNTITNNQGFAQNTAMVFYQETAPTGWTKVTSGIDDKALRVQTGSAGGTTGGSVAFETAFASQTPSGTVSTSVGSTTLALSQIPSHSHSVRGSVASSGSAVFGAGNTAGTNTATAGGGGSHTHSGSSSFSGSAINLDVAYLNVIVCTKDA
jgi:hypothetical protein